MQHYGEKYFQWQKKVGEFGGYANLFKFIKFISPTDDILDFGCGGGFLLRNIQTTGVKGGVEINPYAREEAIENGIKVYASLDEIPESSYDIIISNHALEHVDDPLKYIKQMKRIIRPDGRIVIVVPHEVDSKYNQSDNNMHLFTWSPQNLRNLFLFSGDVEFIDVSRIYHSWPRRYVRIQKMFGWRFFNIICFMNSILFSKFQTRVAVIVKK